jgi:hypothetical protein
VLGNNKSAFGMAYLFPYCWPFYVQCCRLNDASHDYLQFFSTLFLQVRTSSGLSFHLDSNQSNDRTHKDSCWTVHRRDWSQITGS